MTNSKYNGARRGGGAGVATLGALPGSGPSVGQQHP